MFITEVVVGISILVGIYVSVFFMLTFFTEKKYDKRPQLKTFPVVTIAIPFHNEDPEVLRKTVDSVLALDYPRDKLDVILIDDGSTNDAPLAAKEYVSKGVTFLQKANGGKGSCLNEAIKIAKGKYFGCLDVDSVVDTNALRRMVPYFTKDVMAVTPSLKVITPTKILERVQMVEFLLGVYLRKVFSYLNAIHVTPGPFTLFRVSFFKKYGSYDESTLTEDIEVALRIQKNGYKIENCIDANVYTQGVAKFAPLQKQRLRWYKGFIDNVWRYKSLFSKNHSHLGMFILPMSLVSVGLLLIATALFFIEIGVQTTTFYQNLAAVNWDVSSLLLWNFDLFYYDINMLTVISLIAFAVGLTGIFLAKIYSRERQRLLVSLVFFILLYTFLFSWWWTLAIYYKITKKPIYWAGRAFT